jgi:hypothetical protein
VGTIPKVRKPWRAGSALDRAPRAGLQCASLLERRGFELPVLFGLSPLERGRRPAVSGQKLPADRSRNIAISAVIPLNLRTLRKRPEPQRAFRASKKPPNQRANGPKLAASVRFALLEHVWRRRKPERAWRRKAETAAAAPAGGNRVAGPCAGFCNRCAALARSRRRAAWLSGGVDKCR